MRILSILAFVAAAQAATIQLKLDGFQLMAPGAQFAMQIRLVSKTGVEVPKTLRLTNIQVNNAVLDLDATTQSGKIWGDLQSGISLMNNGGALFISDLLIFINSGSNQVPLLTFDLFDAETGQRYSGDEFGIFLYEYVPSNSTFASNFAIGSSSSGSGNTLGLIDPSNPNDPNNPNNPNNPPGPGTPQNPIIDPPVPEVPEPSTYLLVLSALGVISSRYSTKRGT